jgi:hypothetical protein
MRPGSALVIGLLAAAPLVVRGGERIVLVPVENVTRAAGAREAVMAALASGLEQRGYEVIQGEQVEAYLKERRIRYLDSLPVAQAGELLSKLGADAVMVGSILSYDRRRTDPVVALSLSVVAGEGQVLWSDVAGLAASESKGPLDLRKTANLDVLAQRLVAQMLDRVPSGEMGRGRGSDRSWWRSGPRVFRDPDLLQEELTICVLPLENLSGARDAPRVVEAAIQHRLAERLQVKPVLPADLRRFVIESGLRAPSRLTPSQLEKLAKATGTPYFLQGSIFAYGTTAGGDRSGGTPVVEIYLRLLDVNSGRTVWSGLNRRTGIEYEKLLRMGDIRDPATLASHVVGELVQAFTRR